MSRPGMHARNGSDRPESLDMVKLNHQASVNVRKYLQEKDRLLAQGQAGDIGALLLLKKRFGLRLPAVEGRLMYSLPWMGKV